MERKSIFENYQSSHGMAYDLSIYAWPEILTKAFACIILHTGYLGLVFLFVYLVFILPTLICTKDEDFLILEPIKEPAYSAKTSFGLKVGIIFCLKLLFTMLFPGFSLIIKKITWFYNFSATSLVGCLGLANWLYFPSITSGDHYTFIFLCILCVRRIFAAYFNISYLKNLKIFEFYIIVQIIIYFKLKTEDEIVLDTIPLKYHLSYLLFYWCLHAFILYFCFSTLLLQFCTLEFF